MKKYLYLLLKDGLIFLTKMKKYVIISVLIIIMCIYPLVYGFAIGGIIDYKFYIPEIIIVMIVLLLSLKKEKLKNNIVVIILFISIYILSSAGIYKFVNNNFDETELSTFDTTIYDYEGRKTFLEYGWFFKDLNGEECFYSSIVDYFSEEYNSGDSVRVTKYGGTFGVEHYKIKKK